jgi:hypothetical protein|nr:MULTISPECIES: hypothetical protein [unclassified Acidovorax]
MPVPEIAVLDLTSRIGGYALAQLGVTGTTGHGAWEKMPLGGVAGSPEISWYRPANVPDLSQLPAQPDAVAILVGPGAFTMLPAVLALQPLLDARAVWFFLLPNAVMEDMEIAKFLRTHPRAGVHKYQLPNSDPQTLWFVLMEQVGKVKTVNEYFNEEKKGTDGMSSNLKSSMDAAMTIDGALAVALVDYRSGMCLAQAGSGMNLDLAAAGNTQVVQAKLKTMESLGIRRGIEDILITLAEQYHLIRLIPNNEGLFLYLVLDRSKGNLALARYRLTDLERSLKV